LVVAAGYDTEGASGICFNRIDLAEASVPLNIDPIMAAYAMAICP
jgi:hypothetical protein